MSEKPAPIDFSIDEISNACDIQMKQIVMEILGNIDERCARGLPGNLESFSQSLDTFDDIIRRLRVLYSDIKRFSQDFYNKSK